MHLRYGLNPPAAATATADRWPIAVVNGVPSYVNLLDALNAWQLVREASAALGTVVAASFKHVSPAGVATGATPRDAYERARDADPRSSYGDFAAVSAPVDEPLARLLAGRVSDGIVAPGFEPGAVNLLRRKKNGAYLIVDAFPDVAPPRTYTREVFGVRLTTERDAVTLDRSLLADLPAAAADDLLLGLVTVRYTQSNAVCYVRAGQTIGIGAGQQSRVDCTRLAGSKVDTWWLRRHPHLALPPGPQRPDRINAQVAATAELPAAERTAWLRRLTDVAFASDGALPFRDNVEEAHRHGVTYIAEPGGSVRSPDIAAACAERGITLVQTGIRLFHH